MGTISDKLTYLAETKEALKDKLESIGLDTSTGDTFRDYVDKIDDYFPFYAYANALMPLPNTYKNISGYGNMYVSPNVKIYAKTVGENNYSSYTVEEWRQLVINYTNNSADIKNYLEPVGIEFITGIEHFVVFFFLEDMDDYYPVPGCDKTGTTTKTKLNYQSFNTGGGTKYYGYRHSMCYLIPVNSTNYNGTGKLKNPDNSNATITRDKNYFVLGSPNTHYTWRIKENCGFRIWMSEPEKDILRAETLYKINEWMRHRASIVAKDANGNDITTTIPDTSTYKQGTDEPDLYKVDIETVDGEMYFKIIVDENDSSKDILTSNLAKYNEHNFFSNYNPQSSTSIGLLDQIYSDQKLNGINMNSGLDSNDPIKILTPGAKGAEAYVFQGKWRIITPILSLCNTLDYTTDRNCIDAPVIYYWKNVVRPRFEAMGIHNVQLLNEKWGQIYAINRQSASSNYTNAYYQTINHLITFLRNPKGGGYSYDVVHNAYSSSIWTSSRMTESNVFVTYLGNYPNLSWSGPQGRLIPIFGVDLEPLAPPVITYDENDTVTITAETGTEIYYTISYSSTPDIEPTLIEIMKGNTKIKKYTGPFKSNAQLQFIIRAIAVKYKQKCSVESCEYFEIPPPAEPTIYQYFGIPGSIYYRISAESEATIYYTKTLDEYGIVPNPNDLGDISTGHTKKYTTNENIYINTNYYYNTIKAIAVKNGVSSSVATMTYYYNFEDEGFD